MELCEIIVTSTEQLVKAVSHMPRLDDIDEYCIEINRLENAADDIYRNAIGRLFENGTRRWMSSNGSTFTRFSNPPPIAAKTSPTPSKPSA
jgi:uncharacterized protein Yka (UPF0111/DUF47 family)